RRLTARLVLVQTRRRIGDVVTIRKARLRIRVATSDREYAPVAPVFREVNEAGLQPRLVPTEQCLKAGLAEAGEKARQSRRWVMRVGHSDRRRRAGQRHVAQGARSQVPR